MNTFNLTGQPDDEQVPDPLPPTDSPLDSQLEQQLLALQSGSPLTGEPRRPFQPRGEVAALPRVLLISQGSRAHAVAQAAVAASARWLPSPLPLAWVAADGEQGVGDKLEDAVAAAAEQLAGRELAAALQQQGYQLDRHAEFHAWLLVDLDHAPGDSSPAQVPGSAVSMLRAIDRSLRGALRLRTLPHVLLVARPQAGAAAARWAAALQQAGIADVCLCSSVNLEHQSLSDGDWIEQAALALAALCWSHLPSYAQREQPGAVCVLAAAAWPSSLAQVRHWLELRSAGAALERLLNDGMPQGTPVPSSSQAPSAIDVRAWMAQLSAQVPQPKFVPPWLDRAPAWSSLPGLPQELAAEERQRAARLQIDQRQARMAWLDAVLDRWSAEFTAASAGLLAGAAGRPYLRPLDAYLEGTAQGIAGALCLVDEELERAALAVAAAEAAEGAAHSQLCEVTAMFPAPSLPAALELLLRVWRWPALLWAYLQLLPERCHAFSAAQAERRACTAREADWHVLRQVLLAMQTTVRKAAQEQAALRDTVTRMAALLQASAAQLEQGADLAPWLPATLEQLWQATERDLAGDRLAVFLATNPIAQWRAEQAEPQAAALLAAMAGEAPALDGWTALDCLFNGLERAELAQSDPVERLIARRPLREPFAWLDAQLQRALPLWPKPSLRPELAQQDWLLLPSDCVTAGRAGARHALSKLHWWLDTQQAAVGVGVCSGTALVFLRWANVAIADLDNEE